MNRKPSEKWVSPRNWLCGHIEELAEDKDFSALRELCQQLRFIAENDSIQIAFQREMDADGYFETNDIITSKSWRVIR